MVNKVDTLLNFKDASGVLNEIYPITKKENVQGLSQLISDSLLGYAKKTDLDGYSPKSHMHDDRYYTEDEINTKLGSYLPKSGGTLTGALTLKGAPTADLQAATKKYVDDKVPLVINALTLTDSNSITNAFNLIREAYEAGRIVFLKNTGTYSVLTHCSEAQAVFWHESYGIVTETLMLPIGNMRSRSINIAYIPCTVTLTSANWDSVTKAQTVNANEVTTTNIVIVSPSTKASADIWAESEVFCTEQGDGTLKFTCTYVPTSDITVSVVIIG